MLQKIFAPRVFDGNGHVWRDCLVIRDGQGVILECRPNQANLPIDTLRLEGWIIPGFINTHCHLELSHLKGLIQEGTGLIPFIKEVIANRHHTMEAIQESILNADRAMWEAGIDAVGDICNTADTAQIKAASPIYYHSFVEVFDLMNADRTQQVWAQGMEVLQVMPGAKSLVPHAPYSISVELMDKLAAHQGNHPNILSIHNQETFAENEMFTHHRGDFVQFYKDIGLHLDLDIHYSSSSEYYLRHARRDGKQLFVHNTFTTDKEITDANTLCQETFWTTCPKANLYIERRLPSYDHFIECQAIMTIGTDSLASNNSLDIWSEMLTIKQHHPHLSDIQLLTWGCIQGAQALDVSDKLGHIDVGKQPGLLHLATNHYDPSKLISPAHQPKRLPLDEYQSKMHLH